jgi:signal transduction histidine kinase/CheY-like chemotaxis protein
MLSYQTYITYQVYNKENHQVTTDSFLVHIDNVLNAVFSEEKATLEYLHHQNTLANLRSVRLNVDQLLRKLREDLFRNKTFIIKESQIKEVEHHLSHVRDESKGDLHNIVLWLNYYHTKIYKPFERWIESIQKNEVDKVKVSYLKLYQVSLYLRENSNLEFLLVSNILQNGKKISIEENIFWKKLINNDTFSKIRNTEHDTLLRDNDTFLSNEAYDSFLRNEREMILTQSKSGNYSVSLDGWKQAWMAKEVYYSHLTELIINAITDRYDEFNVQYLILFIFILLLIVLLFFIIKLVSLLFKKHINGQISVETLRDIELVFTKSQQKELKRLIASERVDYIYKFLIQAIKDANQTKDLFLASMSHEIRTPLNGILGFTELLKETTDKEEQEEFISVIEKSSENLLTIVNDILDLSKIKAQKIELENIVFDPIKSFEVAIESYAAKASAENIDLNVFIDPQLPTELMGDPTKISQVIINLMSNAIKFTSANGEVNIRIEKSSEHDDFVTVDFSVEDTGIGISETQKGKFFEAFTQADVSTSRQYGGTGLGLSISGRFIELMGSELKIESIKDEGSTFFFTLVLKKSINATKRLVERKNHMKIGILNYHIDTEYYINTNLETYLHYTGATIERYTDETLLSAKVLPDILFIDHKFRYRDGEIKKFLNVDTKIIIMTTAEQKRNLKRYASSIDRILFKPINFTKILKILNENEEVITHKKQIKFNDIHILVAEDNKINQKLILNVLERLGIEVSFANNGQEALNMRINNEYDMIFMDIEMPIMGGMESTGKIILHEREYSKKHIPIVALTANALSGDKEKYIGIGMDDYLSKPIQLDNLKSMLCMYFEKNIVH